MLQAFTLLRMCFGKSKMSLWPTTIIQLNPSNKKRKALNLRKAKESKEKKNNALLRFRRGWIACLWNANATSEQLVTSYCVGQEKAEPTARAERASERASAPSFLAPLPLPPPRARPRARTDARAGPSSSGLALHNTHDVSLFLAH